MELFIDESDDLGGVRSSKRYFVVAGVECKEGEIRPRINAIL